LTYLNFRIGNKTDVREFGCQNYALKRIKITIKKEPLAKQIFENIVTLCHLYQFVLNDQIHKNQHFLQSRLVV
jgi:hypothetical protein